MVDFCIAEPLNIFIFKSLLTSNLETRDTNDFTIFDIAFKVLFQAIFAEKMGALQSKEIALCNFFVAYVAVNYFSNLVLVFLGKFLLLRNDVVEKEGNLSLKWITSQVRPQCRL